MTPFPEIDGTERVRPVPTLNDIKMAVSREFRVPVVDLESARRLSELARPRHAIFYLARKHTRASFPAIARAVGRRDHTTVMYGAGKCEERMMVDREYAAKVVAVEVRLIDEL